MPATLEETRREVLAEVAHVLRSVDVPFFVVPTYLGSRYRLGVLATSRGRARAALERAAPAAAWRLRPARQGAVLGVSRHRAPAGRSLVRNLDSGVVLEWWEDTASGWRAPVANAVATLVRPEEQQAAVTVDVGGGSYPTVRCLARRPSDDVEFPLDVVFTWVDGADRGWRRDRDRRLAELGGRDAVMPRSAIDARFADHDELRYALRSVEQFLPWVRRVHLVTAGRHPSWIRRDHPRLHLVEHRDILDAAALPTFNSRAIETGLHHIDGLSDRYLYFNDDMFVGRPLGPRTFFHGNGVSMFFPVTRADVDPGPPRADDLPVMASTKNVRDLLESRFGARLSRTMLHTPQPQQRSVLLEIEDEFADAIKRTRHNPFRSADDVSPTTSLHHYYAYLTGRAVPGRIRYAGTTFDHPALGGRLRAIRRRRPEVFCVNDGPTPAGEAKARATLLQDRLSAWLPTPSSFEAT